MNGLYRFARALTGLLLRLGGFVVTGQEHIPENESVLILANHTSFGDPVALASAFPYQITFIAKEEFLKNWFTRTLFGKGLGCTFLKKDEGDLGAIRVSMQALKSNKSVGIFPEGKRNFDHQLGEFKAGATFIAARAKVRVLPVAILNGGDLFRIWKRNIRVLIGQPLEVPLMTRASKESMAQYTELCREKVAELLAEGQTLLAQQGRKMRKPPRRQEK